MRFDSVYFILLIVLFLELFGISSSNDGSIWCFSRSKLFIVRRGQLSNNNKCVGELNKKWSESVRNYCANSVSVMNLFNYKEMK